MFAAMEAIDSDWDASETSPAARVEAARKIRRRPDGKACLADAARPDQADQPALG